MDDLFKNVKKYRRGTVEQVVMLPRETSKWLLLLWVAIPLGQHERVHLCRGERNQRSSLEHLLQLWNQIHLSWKNGDLRSYQRSKLPGTIQYPVSGDCPERRCQVKLDVEDYWYRTLGSPRYSLEPSLVCLRNWGAAYHLICLSAEYQPSSDANRKWGHSELF